MLPIPVTVVLADDDPSTRPPLHEDWERVIDHVDRVTLQGGGHYFLRTHPKETAEIVQRFADPGALQTSFDGGHQAGEAALSTAVLSSQRAVLEVDLQPGKPALLHVDSHTDAATWAAHHREAVRALVTEHGAVQIRGLSLTDEAEVSAVARHLTNALMTPLEAFASREEYPGGVYSSSAWAPSQQMCMHHEQSFRLEFPSLMLFGCLEAPTQGGAIALADSPSVLRALPPETVDAFIVKGGYSSAATPTRSDSR